MTIDEILDLMDELLDKAVSVPFANKKSLVDVEQLREYIDNIRYNMPNEIKTAKEMVSDRSVILTDAGAKAENIIKNAEERAKILVSETEIVKQAQKNADEIIAQAKAMEAGIKKSLTEKLEAELLLAEKAVEKSLAEIKNMQNAVAGKQA